MENGKKPWLSKSIWLGFLVAGSAFVPPVHDFIVANPEIFASVVGGLFAALRLVTKGKIVIS